MKKPVKILTTRYFKAIYLFAISALLVMGCDSEGTDTPAPTPIDPWTELFNRNINNPVDVIHLENTRGFIADQDNYTLTSDFTINSSGGNLNYNIGGLDVTLPDGQNRLVRTLAFGSDDYNGMKLLDNKAIGVRSIDATYGFNERVTNVGDITVSSNAVNNELSKMRTTSFTWQGTAYNRDSVRMFVFLNYLNPDTNAKYSALPNNPNTFFEVPDNGTFALTPQLMAGFAPNNIVSVTFTRAYVRQFKRNNNKDWIFIKSSTHFYSYQLKP